MREKNIILWIKHDKILAQNGLQEEFTARKNWYFTFHAMDCVIQSCVVVASYKFNGDARLRSVHASERKKYEIDRIFEIFKWKEFKINWNMFFLQYFHGLQTVEAQMFKDFILSSDEYPNIVAKHCQYWIFTEFQIYTVFLFAEKPKFSVQSNATRVWNRVVLSISIKCRTPPMVR